MIRLKRTVAKPIYRQITEWMREEIAVGSWPEHYRLKSEIVLADELGVNRGTLRKAIAELIAEGLLVTIHGRGTFVASQTLEQPLAEQLIALSEDLINKGIPFETRVLEQSVVRPSQRVASLLSIASEAEVLFLKRVRVVRQAPLVLLHNYVVHDRCPGIEQVDFTQRRLFETLEGQYGLTLAWGRRAFQAQMAGAETAKLLSISTGDPTMYIEQITYSPDGSPIELSDLWLRGDCFRLSAIVTRNGAKWTSRSSHEFISPDAVGPG